MDARTAARIAAVQALYEQEVNSRPINDNIDHDKKAHELAKANEFARINKKLFGSIFGKAAEDIVNIDEQIKQNLSEEWSFERIGGVLRGILRAALAESKLADAKTNLIISEYTNIAAMFFDDKETGFVNAILHRMLK